MTIRSAILYLISTILSVFKKLLCFLNLKRNRKNSSSLLPLHVNVKTFPVNDYHTSLPSNEFESWETWANDDKLIKASKVSNIGNNSPSEIEHEEIDYFQQLNLEPDIKKAKKIILRKKDDYSLSSSNRLAMTNDVPLMNNNDLGILEDSENNWAEESLEDLSIEAESAIRDNRRSERERKLIEHQQKKLEKDLMRNSAVYKKDRIVTKLS